MAAVPRPSPALVAAAWSAQRTADAALRASARLSAVSTAARPPDDALGGLPAVLQPLRWLEDKQLVGGGVFMSLCFYVYVLSICHPQKK